MNRTIRVVCLIAAAAAGFLTAQGVPFLSPAYAGSVTVSGKIAPGAGPVTIFDLSYPAKTEIGTGSSVDGAGNFAVSVKPALIEGHLLVVVDAHGNSSTPAAVVKAPPSPAALSN